MRLLLLLLVVAGCSVTSLFGAPIRCDADDACEDGFLCSVDGICVVNRDVGEGEGDVVGEGEGEGEGDVVGEGEGEDPCAALYGDAFDDVGGAFSADFFGDDPSANVFIEGGDLVIDVAAGNDADYVAYAGETRPADVYVDRVVELHVDAFDVDGFSEFFMSFDGAGGSVLFFVGAEFAGISVREESPSFHTFDAAVVDSSATGAYDAQLRFDGPTVSATINGVDVVLDGVNDDTSLAYDYRAFLSPAFAGITAGCFSSCDGHVVRVADVKVFPACRAPP